MNKPRKQKRAAQSRCALIGGSISVSSANALIADWRKHAKGAMGMARHHDKAKWDAHAKRQDKQSNEHESDRYRWRRVAETFRHCAKELRRQVVLANKRQPKSNNSIGLTQK